MTERMRSQIQVLKMSFLHKVTELSVRERERGAQKPGGSFRAAAPSRPNEVAEVSD